MPNKRIAIFGSVIAALVLVSLPIPFPFNIETSGKILPSREWLLCKGTDGGLFSTLIDHKYGIVKNYTIIQAERGDAGGFAFRPEIFAYNYVEEGDTIGQFYSNEIERRFVRLRGELAAALASLALYNTGEKPSVVREAQNRIEFAIKETEERHKILERQRKLFQEQLISLEELEISQLSAQLSEIKKNIAEDQFRMVSTGAKQEHIDYIRSQIAMLHSELSIYEDRLNSFVITSPIAGILNRTFSGDTLTIIADTSAYVLFMPLRLGDFEHISKGQAVEIAAMTVEKPFYGEIIHVDNNVYNLNGNQVVFVAAEFNADDREIQPGLLTRCKISCQPLTLLHYLSRTISSITFQ